MEKQLLRVIRKMRWICGILWERFLDILIPVVDTQIDTFDKIAEDYTYSWCQCQFPMFNIKLLWYKMSLTLVLPLFLIIRVALFFPVWKRCGVQETTVQRESRREIYALIWADKRSSLDICWLSDAFSSKYISSTFWSGLSWSTSWLSPFQSPEFEASCWT